MKLHLPPKKKVTQVRIGPKVETRGRPVSRTTTQKIHEIERMVRELHEKICGNP